MPDNNIAGAGETSFISRPPPVDDSRIKGVSIRSWIALGFCLTVCTTHLVITLGTVIDAILTKDFSKVGTLTTIGEPLYSLSIAAVSFYFGTRQTTK